MNRRVKYASVHLACSAVVAALAWLLVSLVWYPKPLASLAGGAALFFILVSVDVVIGPALTAVVAAPRKARGELRRDLGVILLLQAGAFAYGMYSVAAARPVAIAFEIDLFRVVSAAEVDSQSLHKAPPSLRHLPWTGPSTLAAVKPVDSAALVRTIELGLEGIPLAALPEYWREYRQEATRAWAVAKPVSVLIAQRPDVLAVIEGIASREGVNTSEMRYLPLLARKSEGVAILVAPDARVAGILPTAMAP